MVPVDSDEPRTRRIRVALLLLASAAIGVGIPLGWIWIAGPEKDTPEHAGAALGPALGGIAGSYVLLTMLVSVVSGRSRARSRGRRMRGPWARGLTEWQPSGWTYHLLEEILIGAALISSATCVILLFTVGGFAG